MATRKVSYGTTPETAAPLYGEDASRTSVILFLNEQYGDVYITANRPEGGASGNNVITRMKGGDTFSMSKLEGDNVRQPLFVIGVTASGSIHVHESFGE